MKTIALLLCLVTMSCYQDDGDFCTAPHGITIAQTCYAGNGLVLRVGDYGKSSGDFQWEIYALKETAKIIGLKPSDLKTKINAPDQLTVADSIVRNNQRLIVTVANNREGVLKQSTRFAFIKTSSVANPCIRWVVQQL